MRVPVASLVYLLQNPRNKMVNSLINGKCPINRLWKKSKNLRTKRKKKKPKTVSLSDNVKVQNTNETTKKTTNKR